MFSSVLQRVADEWVARQSAETLLLHEEQVYMNIYIYVYIYIYMYLFIIYTHIYICIYIYIFFFFFFYLIYNILERQSAETLLLHKEQVPQYIYVYISIHI